MTIQDKIINFDHSQICCDICGADEIAETVEGFVCRNCGVELTIQRLEYNRPFEEGRIQHSKGSGLTQIGTQRERKRSGKSWELDRLNKHNSSLEKKELDINRAFKEISKIFELFSLHESLRIDVLTIFKDVWDKLQPGTKFRNPEKLSAIIIYVFSRVRNIVLDENKLIEFSTLTGSEFRSFLLHVYHFLPEYVQRRRQEYVAKKIYEITQHFELGMPFFFLSRKILDKLWDVIKNTKDSVVAGLCTSIATLVAYKGKVNTFSICKLLNIKMSTIQFQVKKRIFEKFRVGKFESLVKSSSMLKIFMEKIGVLGDNESEKINKDKRERRNAENVKLGNAPNVFNPDNDHFMFELVAEGKKLVLGYLEVQENGSHNEKVPYKIVSDIKFNLTLGNYIQSKDPPLAK
ncbi:MAG: hypothetical protein ACXACX_20090 [Candidatus Hodarchaeales archaeon]|jgi:hypothetical protein